MSAFGTNRASKVLIFSPPGSMTAVPIRPTGRDQVLRQTHGEPHHATRVAMIADRSPNQIPINPMEKMTLSATSGWETNAP